MRLDHVNLTVHDVLQARDFLQKYFGYTDAFADNNEAMAVLMDAHGMHLSLMKGKQATYPKMFHIGFALATEAEVSAVYERLTNDGMAIKPPKHTQWGSWTFHFTCPGSDFIIEVACASEAQA